jgi:ubiquinone/menaquinone biosynthesis C-methylase UbiE
MDLSKNLLAIAKQKMKRKTTEFPLVRADMRYFPFRSRVFYAVINMFTSFGYLPSEKEDMKSLNEVKRVLQKNGLFLIDIVNKDYVTNVYKERDWAEFEPFYLLENRTLDVPKSMMLSEWTIIRKDTNEVRRVQHNLRLYSFQKLRKMLSKVGLTVKQVYGGYDKKKFNSNASRMIMLAQRK